MPQRLLRLGTRRSALARAQSAQVARALEQLRPSVRIELVGIDTRGDRSSATPLAQMQGKEFFTAEIDAALLDGAVDFTVHSYKDLSLERAPRLLLAAVPQREPPQDVVLFAADVRARLAAGAELRIGSSSPRRAAFVPEFLRQALPGASVARVRLCELRGNVDTRLRRLHEAADSERRLDGVVLALAGLVRLWRDEAGRTLLQGLLAGLPRMLLPLSTCPTAPAQGALAVECRREDQATAELLAPLEHAPTRQAVAAERALLAARGGGCHQRFGATQMTLPGLGTLLYERDAEAGGEPQLQWQSETALGAVLQPVVAWDGSRIPSGSIEVLNEVLPRVRARLSQAPALFVAHRRAAAELAAEQLNECAHIWVPGIETWWALARRGVWVEGCADGLGFAALTELLREPLLQLPPPARWLILTHEGAAAGWREGEAIGTYRHTLSDAERPAVAAATHLYWASSEQYQRWHDCARPQAQHACGPGKTYDLLRYMQVHNLRAFPSAALWRRWLSL